MEKIHDYFKMYCPKCNREYTIDAFETNPVCEDDGAGLDFVPRGKERKGDDT